MGICSELWDVSESAPQVRMTIEAPVRRYLDRSVNAERDVLMLVRDSESPDARPQWAVNPTARTALPPKALKYCCITRLGNLTVVIAQKPHLRDLSGRVMRLRSGTLVID